MPPIPEYLVQYEEREEERDIESWLNGFENWNPTSVTRDNCPMDIDSDDFDDNVLPIHQPSAQTVSQFLQSYSGPGTITKIKPSRKTSVSRVVDWDEDLIIPATQLQPTTKQSFKRALSPESSWVDSSVSAFQDTVPAFRSDEEDLLLPPGVTQLKLPTEPKRAPLTIDIEGSSSDDPEIMDPPERLNPFLHLSNSQSFQQGEEFLDIVFPPTSSDLQLKRHQPKNNSFGSNEENLLDGLIIPNESVFMLPTTNPKITRKRIPLSPKRHAQIRDTYTSPSSKFNQRLLVRKKTPTSANIKIPSFHCPVIPAAPLAVGSNSNSIILTSPIEYGDGTELDDLDNLPVQRTFPSQLFDTQVLELLDHFSESQVQSHSPPAKRKRVKPMLIQNLNSNKMRRVVGKMRFNPQACNWEGNEDALLDFKSVSSIRPALITNLNGHKRAHKIGNAVFDPVLLRWFTQDNEEDPFEGIDDIPDHSDSFSPSNTFGPGNDFYLSPNHIDDMYASEGKHRKFIGRWFPDPDSALLRLKYLHLGPSQPPPHLHNIRHPTHPWLNPPDPSNSTNQGSNSNDEMSRYNSSQFNQHPHNQHHPSTSPP